MIRPEAPDYSSTPVSNLRTTLRFDPQEISKHPLISIVTPFFNPGEIFLETVLTVLQQSFQNFEWVIVDDASTDPAAAALLSDIEKIDPRIRVERSDTNSGPSVTRNKAVELSTAPFVFTLDADDLIEPT